MKKAKRILSCPVLYAPALIVLSALLAAAAVRACCTDYKACGADEE